MELTNHPIRQIRKQDFDLGIVTPMEGQWEGPKLGIKFYDEEGEEAGRFIVTKDSVTKLMLFIWENREELFPKKGSSK